MYIAINDVIGEKMTDPSYPIKGKDGPCGPPERAELGGWGLGGA